MEENTEGFLAHRNKMRLRYGIAFLLCVLLFGGVIFYRGWVRGQYGTVPIRTLDQLKTMQGTFFHDISGGRYSYSIFGLRDAKTNRATLRIFAELCGNPGSLDDYAPYPATIWYAEGPGDRDGWMYQLEVGGRMVCSLNETNKKAELRNQGVYLSYLRDLVWFFSLAAVTGGFWLRRFKRSVYKK